MLKESGEGHNKEAPQGRSSGGWLRRMNRSYMSKAWSTTGSVDHSNLVQYMYTCYDIYLEILMNQVESKHWLFVYY